MGDISCSNGISGNGINGFSGNGLAQRKSCWYEEEIEENLRWCFALNSILHTGATQFQDIQLLDTKPFGKALVIDGKLQSAEIDEFIYHESLVHPALLHHPNPKTVFIMGGGEGSTARELLRHKTVEKVVMCDIDQEVVDFCKSYLVVNKEAFRDPRLDLVINDARAELQRREELYDVIIGDLADPIEGGPCYQLYTKSFYEFTIKPRLNQGGIFVTQAGPAGVFSHAEVFSCIYNTLRQVFKYVVPYSAHIPSYADIWGWIMVSFLELLYRSKSHLIKGLIFINPARILENILPESEEYEYFFKRKYGKWEDKPEILMIYCGKWEDKPATLIIQPLWNKLRIDC